MTDEPARDDPDGEPARPLSYIERRLLGGEQPPPVDAALRAVAEEAVNRAALRFKGFRQDFERISNATTSQWKDGRITREDASRLFLDDDHIISGPLVRRYLAAREFKQIADWLRARSEIHFTGWLSERNRLALDGMAQHGEGAMAVQLIMLHLRKIMARAKDLSRAAHRKIPSDCPPDLRAALEQAAATARHGLPGGLGEAELEIAELESWIDGYGSREDRRVVAGWREELNRMRDRFNISQ